MHLLHCGSRDGLGFGSLLLGLLRPGRRLKSHSEKLRPPFFQFRDNTLDLLAGRRVERGEQAGYWRSRLLFILLLWWQWAALERLFLGRDDQDFALKST